jgi:SnoaL-like polyketide cyclase
MTDQTHDLANAWAALWDGDLTQTPRIIAADFVSHAAPLTGGPTGDSYGRDGLNTWVSGIHQVLDDLHFVIELGPFRDGDIVVVRWRADGSYRGGYPDATAQAGTPVRFFGTDTLRLDASGLIVEYWANADSLWFVQQLGVQVVPALPGAP